MSYLNRIESGDGSVHEVAKDADEKIEQLKKELDELKGCMAMTEVNFEDYVEDSQAERTELKKENEESILQAFMAGQIDCGVDPSWSSAQAYYVNLTKDKE